MDTTSILMGIGLLLMAVPLIVLVTFLWLRPSIRNDTTSTYRDPESASREDQERGPYK